MAKHYDKQFKQDALQYHRKDHLNLPWRQYAGGLVIIATFDSWLNQAKENDGEVNHIGSGNYVSEEAKEISRLIRELKNKEDVLKIPKNNWYSGKRRTLVFYQCVREVESKIYVKRVLR